MSDQIQETPQAEVQETPTPEVQATETVAVSAPEQGKKDNWFLKIWRNRTKRSMFMLACCLVLILLATFFGSMIQTAGWSATVTDLRNETNSGKIKLTPTGGEETEYDVKGSVASGILFVPKKASAEKPVPAVVLTHGLYNNREMQLQNAIELVRRGYVVMVIDHGGHGHYTNTDKTGFMGFYDASTFLGAAKYLYNLPQVDKTKIGISGHSMGGAATANALSADSVLPTNQTHENFLAGQHMGIISAGLVQANNAPRSVGTNVIAAGIVKASSDEFFFSSTLKDDTYILQAHDTVEDKWDTLVASGLYVKKGNDYVQLTSKDKFSGTQKYYVLSKRGGPTYYLQSKEAVTFTGRDSTKLDDWTTVNGGIYAIGKDEPLAVPTQFNKNNVPKRGTLVSVQRKGEALASASQSIRVIYEAHETHPMNHFSTVSAAHVVDFFYNAFGVSPISKFIAPSNQTWWLKETFSLLGFLGLFGMLFPVLDMLLGTRLFAALKAKEGEVTEGPILLTRPRKHVSYWLSGILTTVFGAISLKNIYAHDSWYSTSTINKLFAASEGYIFDNIGAIATWGLYCAIFGLVVTALIWVINHAINVFKYGEEAALHDERPFDGFKIRSVGNIFRTLFLALILVGIFYGVIFFIWDISVVDFRFWTFDLRVFDMVKVVSILKYVPVFFVFYMVTAAFSQNYRVKDLPEWATIAINTVFNVFGVMVMIWFCNSYFINNGAMYDSANNLFFIACYPIIPCVAIATVISRRMYVRTGNAWLAGLVNALIMTAIACANTSVAAIPAFTYGA